MHCAGYNRYEERPASRISDGAHDRDRTGEPLPYQGSALPTELRGRSSLKSNSRFRFQYEFRVPVRLVKLSLERETRFELATSSLEG